MLVKQWLISISIVSAVSFSSYFEVRNAVDRYSDRGIPSSPVLPQLAGQTHAFKLAIVNEILYPR